MLFRSIHKTDLVTFMHTDPNSSILEYFPFLLFSMCSYTYTDLFCMFGITLYVFGVPLPLSHVSL